MLYFDKQMNEKLSIENIMKQTEIKSFGNTKCFDSFKNETQIKILYIKFHIKWLAGIYSIEWKVFCLQAFLYKTLKIII